jgi:hypothetical protein
MIRAIASFLLIAASAVAVAQGTDNASVRIRGVVEVVDGHVLTVKARSGQSFNVRLAEDFTVIGIAKADLEDITRGRFIGTTTVGERDGALIALEVHIFPESMRGAGEGHRDWDLRPSSKMTNADVADVTSIGRDRVMTVRYRGGEKKVLVPADAVVVSFAHADRREIKPGAHVFITAQRQPGGEFTAARVNVGLNGQTPPM